MKSTLLHWLSRPDSKYLILSFAIGIPIWPVLWALTMSTQDGLIHVAFGELFFGAMAASALGTACAALSDPAEKWLRRAAFALNLSFPGAVVAAIAYLAWLIQMDPDF